MTRLHQWKGRLQNQTEGYPFENGPPFRSPAGEPIFPVEAGGAGPQNGIDDSVSGFPGPTVVFTFTGTATRAMTLIMDVAYLTVGLEQASVEVRVPVANGATATAIATAVAAALTGAIDPQDIVVTANAGAVTLTCVDQENQMVDGYFILYANA